MLALRVPHLDVPRAVGPYGGWEEISRYPVPGHEREESYDYAFIGHSDGPDDDKRGPRLGREAWGPRDSLCLFFYCDHALTVFVWVVCFTVVFEHGQRWRARGKHDGARDITARYTCEVALLKL